MTILDDSGRTVDASARLVIQVSHVVHQIPEYYHGVIAVFAGLAAAHVRLLLLSNNRVSEPLFTWLAEREEVSILCSRISVDDVAKVRPDWVISYSYRYILGKEVLHSIPGKFINLHISLLPYNRGADPNAWSFLENTPKGVTIHLIDAGIDTGPILVQREVVFEDTSVTLAHAYERLHADLRGLFIENWPTMRVGGIGPKPQTGPGTHHRSRELAAVKQRLLGPQGWDITVRLLQERFRQMSVPGGI